MNCQEALSLLYDIIDHEASEIDVHEVDEHLSRCRDCSGIYRIERSIAKIILARFANPDPIPHLAKLRATVLCQLDEIDAEDC